MKEAIAYFLRPTRARIIVALSLPYIYLALKRLYFYFYVEPSEVLPVGISGSQDWSIPYLSSIIILNLFFSVFMYPLTCSIVAIISSVRSKEIRAIYKKREYLALILVGILVFNPISLTLIFITPFFLYTNFFGTPYPVVQVEEISSASPLVDTLEPKYVVVGIRIDKKERVKVNEMDYLNKIVYSRKYRIENATAFYEALDQAKPGYSITFYTRGGSSYGYLVKKNVTDWGIKVKDLELKRRR